ncbi:hypothetical protein JA1_001327 [Spathaspora sp. JA1]|nr:hypothetical protein JA1_001327 [Spathaspora sp. JA1]
MSKSSKIAIQPKLPYLYVYSKLVNQGKPNIVIGTNGLDNIRKIRSSRLPEILEPITFHMFLVLRETGTSQTEIDQKLKPSQDFFIKVLEGLAPDKSFEELKNEINIQDDIEFLSKSNKLHPQALEMGIMAFYVLCKRIGNSYTFQTDLYNWILAIGEHSILQSHARISKLENVPIFLLFDLVLRNPLFKEEYILQTELWKGNLRRFSLLYIENVSILKKCIDNLIYFGLMFEPSSIAPTVRETLDFYNSPRGGVSVKIGNDFLNELIWNVSLYASRYIDLSPVLVAGIQELLLKYYHTTPKSTVHDELSFRAYMGLILMLSRVSQEKAESLFEIAQQKFVAHNNIHKKEEVAYYIAKIWLANNPEDVINLFNQALSKCKLSTKLWLFFIRKLRSLGLLDQNRSLTILSKIVDSGLFIPKDLITELLHPVKDIRILEEMYLILRKSKKPKDWTSSLLPRYISLLYRNDYSVDELPRTIFPWDKDIAHLGGRYRGLDSRIEYARYLYINHIPFKSVYYIGMMLEGEAKVDLTNIFSLYKSELLDKNLSPNNQCLGVLVQVATKVGSAQTWNNMSPPQVAVNQFHTFVRANDSETLGILPDDVLWIKYITLLSKFEYISELAKIMKWWDDLKYCPSKIVLLELLSAVPQEHAKRHIEHHAKLQRESKDFAGHNWPWPTYDEFEGYRKHNFRISRPS